MTESKPELKLSDDNPYLGFMGSVPTVPPNSLEYYAFEAGKKAQLAADAKVHKEIVTELVNNCMWLSCERERLQIQLDKQENDIADNLSASKIFYEAKLAEKGKYIRVLESAIKGEANLIADIGNKDKEITKLQEEANGCYGKCQHTEKLQAQLSEEKKTSNLMLKDYNALIVKLAEKDRQHNELWEINIANIKVIRDLQSELSALRAESEKLKEERDQLEITNCVGIKECPEVLKLKQEKQKRFPDSVKLTIPKGSIPEDVVWEKDTVVIYGSPNKEHDCDLMGCPSVRHVLSVTKYTDLFK